MQDSSKNPDHHKKTVEIPNTQNSAYPPAPLSLDERIDYCLNEAKRHYDESEADERTSLALRTSGLIKAKLSGEYLNRAQKAADEKGDAWLPLLAKKFGESKIRNLQNFMRLAREWDEKIAPAFEKNPHLTVHDAIGILQGKKPKAKLSDEDKMLKMAFSEARRIFQQVWTSCNWSQEESEIVRDSLRWGGGDEIDEAFASLLAEAVNKLRRMARPMLRQKKLDDQTKRTVVKNGVQFRPFFSWDELTCSEDENAALKSRHPYAVEA